MMSKNSPQLRFEGFSNDWEERKLGDVGDTFTGLTGKTKEDFGHGSAKFVTYVNVFQNPIATLDQLDAVEIDEKQNQVQKGDVFFTTSSETPEEVGMSSVWTYDTKNVYLNSFTFGYRPRVSFDLNYMASMLRSPSIRKKITFLAQGISRYNISKTKMLEIEIPAPNLSEQKKIGSFFKLLDDTIALHQRKLDLLKEQKKGYLQKMFPKNGAKVPELRFAGFADDWEERKLIDLATTYIGLVTTMTENYTNKGTLLIRNSDIKEGRFDLSNPIYLEEQFAEENKTRRMRKGDVVTVHTGDIGTSAMINSELDGAIGFATITTRPTKELDSNFLAWYFNSNYHKKYAKRMSTGDGRSNYNMKDFNKNVIPTPQIDEQQKIGSFFKQLDETIALHQRKLDLLKEQKKGFLQKMFV
ncbi:restriction endonuclease subunit S [Enterococcus faecalis]|uniref:restriction endonuclease subunit S n=1 Tax=Enterococcus faecalis TaxID=1351 RepID=UPI0011439E9F|nr:restriction endonuclease subunit S [Enterococcus faecalis]TQB25663.1 restriction endonuclease subunit S [Enterococcus faecalis]